jgi:hypothetical protein
VKNNRWMFLAIVIVAVLLYSVLPIIFPPESSIVDDSLEYAAQAESINSASWFHPHHLLNNFTHRLVWLVLGGENQPIRVIYLMRWTSHIGMGLALGFVYLIALGMGASRLRALLLAAFLMLGCSLWVFGSVAEVVAPSMAMFLAVVWGLFYRATGEQPSFTQLILWGLMFGLAITWNQIDAIYLPALLLGMWGYARKTRLKSIAAFSIPAIAWSVGLYLIVMLIVRSSAGTNDVYSFATSYARWGVWGKGNLISLPTSWRHLLLVQSFSFLRWELIFNGPYAIAASLAAIAAFVAGIWGWIGGGRSDQDWRLNWGWMVVFILTAIGFINWWQADAWDFWVLPWAILMLGWARFKHPSNRITIPTLIGFTLLIGSFNLVRLELPRREESVNPYYSVLISIKDQGLSDCYELMTANPHLWRYAYYWGRIERAGLYADDGEGNFSEAKKKEIRQEYQSWLGTLSIKPLLIDTTIFDYLDRTKAFPQTIQAKKVTSSAFEGINVEIYEITKG